MSFPLKEIRCRNSLTSTYRPLNTNIPADGQYYFHFKFQQLHLSGTALSLTSINLHLTGHWRSVWPIHINVNIEEITAEISKSHTSVTSNSGQRIKCLQHVKLNFATEESKLQAPWW
jgi:hypothetical protein